MSKVKNKLLISLFVLAALLLTAFTMAVHAANTYSVMLDVSAQTSGSASSGINDARRERIRMPYRCFRSGILRLRRTDSCGEDTHFGL